MKKFTLSSLLLLISFYTAFSQDYFLSGFGYGNPGDLNTTEEYPVGSGLDASWTSILTGSKSSTTWSSTQTLPFSFDFNGSAVTQYEAASCGMLTFETSTALAPSYTNASLPSSSVPSNTVCVWGIQGSGSNDEIVTQTFGSSPNRQHWIMFSSYTLPCSTSCWSYWAIVLEETTNNIYIVDQRVNTSSYCTSALTLGVQIDSLNAYEVPGSPSVSQLATGDQTADDNLYYQFTYGTSPTYDMSTMSITTQPYQLLSNGAVEIEGLLTNLGAQTVTSFTLNYSDGTTTTSDAIAGVSIDQLEVYTYAAPTKWTPSGAGTYTLKVWPSNINGNSDDYAGNDTSELEIMVLENMVQRVPLHEGFTSSTCGPCVAGNQNLTDVLSNYSGKYSLVKYQMDWPGSGDPYYTDEGGERASYYGISSVPHLLVDGSFDDNTSSYTTSDFDDFYNEPAFLDIQVYYTVTGQTVDMNITLSPLADYSQSDNTMHIAIIEDTTFNNTGSNGETEFYSVMKKMVPDADGTLLGAMTEGNDLTYSKSYTFEGSYNGNTTASDPVDHSIEHTVEDFNRLSVVVWVQDESSKEVFQSTTAIDTTNSQSNINETLANGSRIISLFPNPSTTVSYLKYYNAEKTDVTFSLLNLLGENVYTMNVADVPAGAHTFKFLTSDLAEGVYTAQLKIGQYSYSTKIIVVR